LEIEGGPPRPEREGEGRMKADKSGPSRGKKMRGIWSFREERTIGLERGGAERKVGDKGRARHFYKTMLGMKQLWK